MKPLPPRVVTPRHWLLGPVYHVRRDPLHWIPVLAKEYGDIFMIKAPSGSAAIVTSPELARDVLVDHHARYQEKSIAYGVLRILMGEGIVTSGGALWRRQRKLVQPAFHRRRIEALFGLMHERVEACAERLAALSRSGAPIDVAPLLSQLTLDIIARAMFSSDVRAAAADVTRHIALLNEQALRLLRQPWLFLVPQRILALFQPGPARSLASLNRIVQGIIEERRRHTGAHDDLLEMLLQPDEDGSGERMSDAQLRDEVMTIFVAGHETTANAMAWILLLVAQHPEVEEQLVAEIDGKWPAGGLSLATLGEFPYARQVIEESLRVYPTIWSVGRRATEDDELGGYRIPAGMNLLVPIFYFHWSERFWPEPQRFDPSRFAQSGSAGERRSAVDPMVYFPFGAGPRACIGAQFAMQELLILTLALYRRFVFRVPKGASVEADPLITLRPKHGMPLVVEARRPLSWSPS